MVLGENMLVGIGILIALQLNNWNEYLQDRKSEPLIFLKLEIILSMI